MSQASVCGPAGPAVPQPQSICSGCGSHAGPRDSHILAPEYGHTSHGLLKKGWVGLCLNGQIHHHLHKLFEARTRVLGGGVCDLGVLDTCPLISVIHETEDPLRAQQRIWDCLWQQINPRLVTQPELPEKTNSIPSSHSYSICTKCFHLLDK